MPRLQDGSTNVSNLFLLVARRHASSARPCARQTRDTGQRKPLRCGNLEPRPRIHGRPNTLESHVCSARSTTKFFLTRVSRSLVPPLRHGSGLAFGYSGLLKVSVLAVVSFPVFTAF